MLVLITFPIPPSFLLSSFRFAALQFASVPIHYKYNLSRLVFSPSLAYLAHRPNDRWRRQAKRAFCSKSSSKVRVGRFLYRFFLPRVSIEGFVVIYGSSWWFLDQISWRIRWTASLPVWWTIIISSSGALPSWGRPIRSSEYARLSRRFWCFSFSCSRCDCFGDSVNDRLS